MEETWELIERRPSYGDTYRLPVPGGYLYRVREATRSEPAPYALPEQPLGPVAVALCFVPTSMPR